MDTIHLAAAPGTTWALAPQDAEDHLRARFPDLRAWQEQAPASGKDYVTFQVDLDGASRRGSYFARGHLILDDGDADLWADTAAWFLGLLPADARAIAMIESNPDSVRTIPPGADAAQVREILRSLFDVE
ncbi:hypothetical protein ACFVXH_39575 [Kitasatospora sp. NPDC058184]|uniref:hypothetical protein n=1 Tax=Kitasatospora sp. NPDC058184 TaxID=3346370 RepID=UPI0036DE747D